MTFYHLEKARENPREVTVLGLKHTYLCSADLLDFPNLSLLRLEDCTFELTRKVHIPKLEDLLILKKDRGTFPDLAFIPYVFTGLKSLHLEYITNAGDLKEGLGQLKVLRKLIMNNCTLREIPVKHKLPELIKLDLAGNNIDRVGKEIAKLPKLQSLHLESNQIRQVSPELGKLQGLFEIFLRDNQLETLPRLVHFPNLMEIDIAFNKLKTVPPIVLRSPLLRKLNLSGNPIEKLPPSICEVKTLRTLTIDRGKLKRLPLKFDSLKNLTQLVLSSNRFALFPKVLCRLEHLEVLSLANNQIERIPRQIDGMQNLRALDLEGNCLRDLPDNLAELQNLKRLALERNMIKEVPKAVLFIDKVQVRGLAQKDFLRHVRTVFSDVQENRKAVLETAYNFWFRRDTVKKLQSAAIAAMLRLPLFRLHPLILAKYKEIYSPGVHLDLSKKISFIGNQIIDYEGFSQNEFKFHTNHEEADFVVIGATPDLGKTTKVLKAKIPVFGEGEFFSKLSEEHPPYLLQAENEELLNNMLELLNDDNSVFIAVNAMLSGGVPQSAKTDLISLATETALKEPETAKTVIDLCRLYFSEAEIRVAEYFWGLYLPDYYSPGARSFNDLKILTKETDIDISKLYAFHYQNRRRRNLPF